MAACNGSHPHDGGSRTAPVHALRIGRHDADSDDDAALERPRELSAPLAACIRRVTAATPPELAGLIATLEYPSVAEDGCRLALATQMRDPALCDDVALSAVRESCRTRAAIATGAPDACPDAHPDRGRDATCVALATRSPGLCAAAMQADALRCAAIARGDATQCNALDPLLRPRCVADVNALHGLVARSHTPPMPPARVHVRIATLSGALDAGTVLAEADLPSQSRGAMMDTHGVLWIIDPVIAWPSDFAHRLTSDEPLLAASFDVPVRPGRGVATDVRIVTHDGAVYDPRPGGIAGSAQFTVVSHVRGGRVVGSASAVLYVTGSPVQVDLTFDTFIRDVVDPVIIGHP